MRRLAILFLLLVCGPVMLAGCAAIGDIYTAVTCIGSDDSLTVWYHDADHVRVKGAVAMVGDVPYQFGVTDGEYYECVKGVDWDKDWPELSKRFGLSYSQCFSHPGTGGTFCPGGAWLQLSEGGE